MRLSKNSLTARASQANYTRSDEVTALCLGKVSYLVFRVILVIALHELDTVLIFNCLLYALKNNFIFAIVIPSLFFPPRKNK